MRIARLPKKAYRTETVNQIIWRTRRVTLRPEGYLTSIEVGRLIHKHHATVRDWARRATHGFPAPIYKHHMYWWSELKIKRWLAHMLAPRTRLGAHHWEPMLKFVPKSELPHEIMGFHIERHPGTY